MISSTGRAGETGQAVSLVSGEPVARRRGYGTMHHMARRTPSRAAPSRYVTGKAVLLLHEKVVLSDESIIEIVVWRLPRPASDRPHGFKYRLYYGRRGVCLVRYDNETGKGDHRHVASKEMPYVFVSADKLLDDFLADVATWKGH